MPRAEIREEEALPSDENLPATLFMRVLFMASTIVRLEFGIENRSGSRGISQTAGVTCR